MMWLRELESPNLLKNSILLGMFVSYLSCCALSIQSFSVHCERGKISKLKSTIQDHLWTVPKIVFYYRDTGCRE